VRRSSYRLATETMSHDDEQADDTGIWDGGTTGDQTQIVR
jgi:hypothetical protein